MIFFLRKHLLPILIVIVLLFSKVSLYAQDLIIKNNNDSILCKIVTISDTISYIKVIDGQIIKNTLSFTDIKTYQFNFYNLYNDYKKKEAVGAEHRIVKLVKKREKVNSILNISANALYGARLFNTNTYISNNAVLHKLEDAVRNNYGALLDLNFGLDRSNIFSLGLTYSLANSNSDFSNLTLTTPDGNVYSGSSSINVTIKTIEINSIIKFPINLDKVLLSLGFGADLVSYNESVKIANYSFLTGGGGYANNIGFLFDYKLSKFIAISASTKFHSGKIEIPSLSTNKQKVGVDINRFNLGIGLRLFLGNKNINKKKKVKK